MRVVSGKVALVSKNEVNIKINNGHRDFMVEIHKDSITIDDIISGDVNVKVYSMIRNCCASCPKYVLESGMNEKDDNEINQLLKDIVALINEGKIEESFKIEKK